ncbi:MAG: MopE-related protein [Patescibacteria group bacterium]
MQYPNKKNKKLSFVFLLFIITITLNFIFLQNPKAEATGGCGVDCWQQDSTTCKIDHTVLGNWEVCTINQPMRQSNISGGPGCDEGFATTSKWCRQTTCPAGAKGVFTLNGARCDIMQSEVDVVWPSCRVPYSIANGNWDASEGKCILCFDKMEQGIYGDTSGISTVAGDGECDLACGADFDCDEKANGEACTGGTCDSSCKCVTACADADADGFTDIACGGTDCDDTDSNISPGDSEVCGNAVDEDCSGVADPCNVWECNGGTASDCAATDLENCAGLDGDLCGGGTWDCSGACEPSCNVGFGNTCATIPVGTCFNEYEACDCDCVIAACVPATCAGCANGTPCPGGTCSGGVCVPAGPGACNQLACGGAVSNQPCMCGAQLVSANGDYCCAASNYYGDETTCKNASNCNIVGPGPGVEICTGGADEDGDGDVDCADSDCVADPACAGGGGSACDNKVWFFCNPLRGTIEDIFQAGETLIGYILGLIGSIALLLIIIAGVMYMTSMGNEEKITKSKKIITGAVIGLAIALLSYSLLQLVLSIL